MAFETGQKPIHSIIIDTGPLIQNAVSISTIIASAEVLFTTPAIISEIRDAATRSRVETTLKPFLNIRSPTPASVEAVAAFSKKTGDFNSLSRQDLSILALAYELHCERHGGPWGLRNAPNGPLLRSSEGAAKGNEPEAVKKKSRTKKINKQENLKEEKEDAREEQSPLLSDDGWTQVGSRTGRTKRGGAVPTKVVVAQAKQETKTAPGEPAHAYPAPIDKPIESQEQPAIEELTGKSSQVEPPVSSEPGFQHLTPEQLVLADPEQAPTPLQETLSNLQISELKQQPTPPTSDDDSENDWITPENLSQRQAQDGKTQPLATQKAQIEVATMTTDFAMQNVLLQMNLHLLSTNMQRVKNLRTFVLRCQACFFITKDMEKQFCPRCGGPSLSRVSCSTNAKGEFKVHLAKNYQFNNRGNRYSIPKSVAGTSNGRREKGGGKGGWGRDLVLTEDQKEYTRQIDENKRTTARDLMDQDYLPGILTGDRGRAGGKPKVGAGRNVNSRKRF